MHFILSCRNRSSASRENTAMSMCITAKITHSSSNSKSNFSITYAELLEFFQSLQHIDALYSLLSTNIFLEDEPNLYFLDNKNIFIIDNKKITFHFCFLKPRKKMLCQLPLYLCIFCILILRKKLSLY